MRFPTLFGVLLLASGLIFPAQAGTLVQVNAAGALPDTALDLTTANPGEIIGSIPSTTDPLLGVNIFKIHINALAFSAITLGLPFGIPDTELFLFDSSGNGVYANDDFDTGTLSCLPGADPTLNLCPTAPPPGVGPLISGTYFLAITRASNLPLSGGNPMFSFTDSVVGPALSGNHPIDGWDGGAFLSPNFDLVNYDIVLSGTVPEPATWTLFGVGTGLALAAGKRARQAR